MSLKNIDVCRITGSFRDPSGFIFLHDGSIFRQINKVYESHYEQLMQSGLYKRLTNEGLLISHRETDIRTENPDAYKIIRPESVPFISYPYEWCFSQIKSAAKATLRIQQLALQYSMTLKDASAYNIQFLKGKPILIDTLSFERYQEGSPWVAYRQFCQHFLAPIALMSMTDERLNQLARIYIDGIPLDMTSGLLTWRSWFRFGILSHIHLHAKSQGYFGDKQLKGYGNRVSKRALEGIIDNLETTISHIKWRPEGTEWGDYYEDTNYSNDGLQHKREAVSDFLDEVSPETVWDLGANEGVFSRLASEKGIRTVAFDIDPAAVEKNYLRCLKDGDKNLLPLLMDLTNPSSGIGWANDERLTLKQRGPAHTVIALALIHHLVISNNVPFCKLAAFFSGICSCLIIEFVPKTDSQVNRLLRTRKDIFTDYTQERFEDEFNLLFAIRRAIKIKGSQRILYLMVRKGA